MDVKLRRADIVIMASAHNPSIVDPRWLKDNGLVAEDPKHFVHTPDFSARTKKYTEVSELIKQSYLENLRRDLTSLSQNYTFRRSSEVLEFLSDNVSLMPLIEEAYRKIREYFPEEKLILEVVADPEVDNEKELMIFIHTTLNPDEALERLDMLDENWWLDASLEAGEKLCVHMEFQ